MKPCDYCDAPILFARGSGGKWLVLDARPHPQGTRVLDEDGNAGPLRPGARVNARLRYMPHWLTCPAVIKGP